MFILPHLKGLPAGNAGSNTFKSSALDLNFSTTKSLVDSVSGNNLVSFTRVGSVANAATFVDSSGVLQRAVTNLKTFSDAILTTNSYSAINSTLTTVTTTTPTGSTTASLLALNVGANTGNSTDGFNYGVFSLANTTQHTQSLFVKPAGATVLRIRNNVIGGTHDFTLTGNGTAPSISGSLQAASIIPYSDGWYRVSWTFTTTTSAPGNRGDGWAIKTDVADGTNGLYVVGAQLEQASTVGEYVPTVTAINSAPRFDHNPTTGESLGLLVEEARTNSIRNNTGVGAVAGTPGTLPTNWGNNAAAGITISVAGVSTENGIAYTDLNFSGTSATTVTLFVRFEPIGAIAASDTQTWSHSLYIKEVTSATLPAISVSLRTYNSSNAFVNITGSTITVPSSSSNLSTTRRTFSTALAGATIASVVPTLEMTIGAGISYNFTLRIGLPQLELGAFATSVIPTTTATVTRAADVASITGSNFSSWYNQTEGSFYVENQTLQGNPPASTFPGVFSANNGTATNQLMLYWVNATRGSWFVRESGTITADMSSSTVAAGTNTKFAVRYAVNDAAISGNGGTVATDASVTLPTVDRLTIGAQAAAAPLNGTIKRLTFWPTRLSNTTLQQITQP